MGQVANSLFSLDGAEHHRLRRLVSKAFTPRATARLHDTIVDVINDLVDRVAAVGRCDIVADIARPYPIPIICALLGAPREDWQLFSEWADDIFKAFSFDVADDEPVIMRAWGELDAYVDDMVADRRTRLTDDLISDLIRAEDDGDRLDPTNCACSRRLLHGRNRHHPQPIGRLGDVLVRPSRPVGAAGRPSRAGAERGRGDHAPLPDRASAPCASPSTTSNSAGSSSRPARWSSSIPFAANRDPAVYDDPDRFDITRDGAAADLTFGGGVHYCLGANLARLELAEALKIMTRRMPNPRAPDRRPGSRCWG